MIKQIKPGNQIIWFDNELLDSSQSLRCCDADYWQQTGAIVGGAQGRGTTWFIQLDKVQAALRHYRRGGLFGKLVSDCYWFNSWENTRSYSELMLLNRLHAQGVNVPRPIAARAVKRMFFYRADILSERIMNASDLVAVLSERRLSEAEYRKIGAEIAKMHRAQVNHTDLNIHNILLDAQGKVWLIDFDKCRVQPGEQWKKRNLARLERSFIKELNKRKIHWKPADFASLLSGYQQG